MTNLFGEEQSEETPRKPPNRDNWFRGTKNGNPCINMFGRGPEGTTCKTCWHLTSTKWDKKYIKCSIRGTGGGATSDHRAKWPSCGKYVLVESPETKQKDCSKRIPLLPENVNRNSIHPSKPSNQ